MSRVDVTFSTNIKVAAIPEGAQLELQGWGMRAAHVTPVGDVETEVQRGGDDDDDDDDENQPDDDEG